MYKNPEKWKICPDKFIFNISHLIGRSAVVYAPITAYRRHSSNAGFSGAVCGNKRYNNDRTTWINIKNNIKIRPEAIGFILSNRKFFNEKFGSRNTFKFIIKILFSYLYVIRQIF